MKNARIILTVCLIIIVGIISYVHDVHIWLYGKFTDKNANISSISLTGWADKKVSHLSWAIAIPLLIIDFIFVGIPIIISSLTGIALYLIINLTILLTKIFGSKIGFVSFYILAGGCCTVWALIWWTIALCLAGYFAISPALYFVGYNAGWKSIITPTIAYMVRKRWIRVKSQEEREREKAEHEYQEKDKEYEEKIKENERQVASIYRQYPDVAKVPEVLKHVADDLRYKGFFGEIARRFEDEQIMKTTITRTAAVTQVIQLVQTIGQLRKAQADLYKVFYDAEAQELETNIGYIEMQKGSLEEKVKIQQEIDKLILLEKKAGIERNIAKLKKELAEIERMAVPVPPREQKDPIVEAIEEIKKQVISVEEAKADIRKKLLVKGATEERIEKALDEFDTQMAQVGLKKDGLW